MARRDRRAEKRRWFGSDILWRIDYGIDEWARQRRLAGSSRSAPRDLDEILGHGRRWWPRIRSGERRSKSGLCLGEIQEICDIIRIEPEEVVGHPSPLWALRGLASEAKKSSKKGRAREPRRWKSESLLDAALRMRRQGEIGRAAMLLAHELSTEESVEAWVHASFLLGAAGYLQSAVAAATEGFLLANLNNDIRGQGRSLSALGSAYYARGSNERAELVYRAALSLKEHLLPLDLCSLHQSRGCNLRELGRGEEAVVALARALEYAETPGQKTFLWWLQGDLYREEGKLGAALSAYSQGLDLSVGARPEVSAVDQAHLLSVVGVTAHEAGEEELARNLLPTAARLLAELARTAPEARAVLAAAHGAAARGERAAAWERAEAALAALRGRSSSRLRRQV